MTQLKKALERSDAYIEELESQSSSLQSRAPSQSTSSEQTGDGRSSKLDQTTVDPSVTQGLLHIPPSEEASGSQLDTAVNFAMPSTPSTPSSALGRLSLKSPVVRSEKKAGCTRLPYLRRLNFDDCGSFTTFPSAEQTSPKVKSSPLKQKPSEHSANHQTVWSSWEEPCSSTFRSARESEQGLAEEARMDAAFLDIVSELDSMMAEGESSRSHTPRLPPDFDATSFADLDVHADPESHREQQQHGAPAVPESFGESVKRKCHVNLATSSPSKLSRIK